MDSYQRNIQQMMDAWGLKNILKYLPALPAVFWQHLGWQIPEASCQRYISNDGVVGKRWKRLVKNAYIRLSCQDKESISMNPRASPFICSQPWHPVWRCLVMSTHLSSKRYSGLFEAQDTAYQNIHKTGSNDTAQGWYSSNLGFYHPSHLTSTPLISQNSKARPEMCLA